MNLIMFMVAFGALGAVGCMRAHEQKADLGSEVSLEQVNGALKRATAGEVPPPRIGAYLNYVILRRIESADMESLIGGTNVSVVKAETTPDGQATKYRMQINKSFKQTDGSFQNVTSEDGLLVEKPGARLRALESFFGMLDGEAPSLPRHRTTFHHLREADEILPVPAKVRARPDCGGLAKCELPLHYVRFDLVRWANAKTYTKMSFDLGFSRETPRLPFGSDFDRYAGMMVVDCRGTYVPVGQRTVFVRDCQQLEDFQR